MVSRGSDAPVAVAATGREPDFLIAAEHGAG